MKKLLVLMLALLVAATMMVACGNDVSTSSSANGADAAVDLPADAQPDETAEPEVEEADGEDVLTEEQQIYFDIMKGEFADSIESSTGGLCQGDVVIDGTSIKLYCTYKMTLSDEELVQMRALMETSVPDLKESLSPFANLIKEQIPAITSVVVVYNDFSGAEILVFEI